MEKQVEPKPLGATALIADISTLARGSTFIEAARCPEVGNSIALPGSQSTFWSTANQTRCRVLTARTAPAGDGVHSTFSSFSFSGASGKVFAFCYHTISTQRTQEERES
jgi:hypothetical protein